MPTPHPGGGLIATLLGVACLLPIAPRGARAQQNPVPPAPPASQSTPGAPVLRPLYVESSEIPYVDKQWPGTRNHDQVNPPDPHGAAGPKGVMQITNRRVSYWLKTGVLLWETPMLEDLFATSPLVGILVDPRAAFDPATGRFYLAVLETHLVGPNSKRAYLHLAVSKSAHPLTATTSDWHLYHMDVTHTVNGVNYGMDYPGFGYDQQAIYVTANMFSLPVPSSPGFKNCQIAIIDKLQATQGVLSWASVFTPNTVNNDYGRAFTLQPATVLSASGPGDVAYFAEIPYFGPNNVLRLWSLSQPLGARTLRDTLIAIPDRGPALDDAPQCQTAQGVRTWSPTAQGNALWHDGSLWFCHTGSTAGHAVVRYYDVSTNGYPSGAASLAEAGSLNDGLGAWGYQPAIGGNALGDIGIVYTKSDASTCPTIMFTMREAGSSGFAPSMVLKASPAPKLFYKWGDYATVVADPVDDGLWISHELATGEFIPPDLDMWATEWGHIRFPANTMGWPAGGQPVRSGQTDVGESLTADDGAGGMFVAWQEDRETSYNRIGATSWGVYLKHITSIGTLAAGWPEMGVRLSISPVVDLPMPFAIVRDGADGVYVAWPEVETLNVQRITGGGAIAPGWPQAGLVIGNANLVSAPRMIPDGTGGALVCWEASGSVYVQRVLPNGVTAWPLPGVTVSQAGVSPDITSDGAGGAVVAWAPPQVQRVSASGSLLWGSNGVFIADGETPRVTGDGSGGVIVAYQIVGSDEFHDLAAQRITGAGAVAPGWPAEGLVFADAGREQGEQVIVSDGAGGAIVAWRDQRSTITRSDVYALRLSSDGSVAMGWTSGGKQLCDAPGHQLAPAAIADGTGGVIVAWQDRRASPTCSTGPCGDDLYYTRVTAGGVIDSPTACGVQVVTAAGNQGRPALTMVSSDMLGVVWEDGRAYPDCVPWCTVAVYAQRIPLIPRSPVAVTEVAALEIGPPHPNPASADVTFRYRVPATNAGHPVEIAVFDIVGRRLRMLNEGLARPGDHVAVWDLRTDEGRRVQGGLYYLQLRIGDARVSRSLVIR